MTLPARINEAQDGRVLRIVGQKLELFCTAPFAPGQPLSIVLELDSAITVTGKTLQSRKRDDGSGFDVTLRVHALPKAHRLALVEVLSGS